MITQSILKLIALFTMALDHVGLFLFTEVEILRIIGRLAFPIFAYLIAEGCIHTRNKWKYLLRIIICATAYQIVIFFVGPTFTLSVLWSYAAAVGFAILRDWTQRNPGCAPALLLYAAAVSLTLLALKTDYLCFSFLLILAFMLIQKPWLKWIAAAVALACVSLFYQYQCWGLCALPILMLYNGQRGRLRIGKFMYWFYPLHYLVLGILAYIFG